MRETDELCDDSQIHKKNQDRCDANDECTTAPAPPKTGVAATEQQYPSGNSAAMGSATRYLATDQTIELGVTNPRA